jgi:hypothetical protein
VPAASIRPTSRARERETLAGGHRTHPPRTGVWPIKPEWLPQRQAWIDRYEAAAQSFAACRFMESLGSGTIAPGCET